jgi:hypothetical protein
MSLVKKIKTCPFRKSRGRVTFVRRQGLGAVPFCLPRAGAIDNFTAVK